MHTIPSAMKCSGAIGRQAYKYFSPRAKCQICLKRNGWGKMAVKTARETRPARDTRDLESSVSSTM